MRFKWGPLKDSWAHQDQVKLGIGFLLGLPPLGPTHHLVGNGWSPKLEK